MIFFFFPLPFEMPVSSSRSQGKPRTMLTMLDRVDLDAVHRLPRVGSDRLASMLHTRPRTVMLLLSIALVALMVVALAATRTGRPTCPDGLHPIRSRPVSCLRPITWGAMFDSWCCGLPNAGPGDCIDEIDDEL